MPKTRRTPFETELPSARAGRLGHGRERVRELAQRLADGLAAMGRLADAAAVTGGYLGDVDGAVALLARAREWREARAPPGRPRAL